VNCNREFNTRRRDSTRQLSGVGGVYWAQEAALLHGPPFRSDNKFYANSECEKLC